MSAKRRKSEMLPDQGFHCSLRLLEEIRSRAVWSGALTFLLFSVMILLLCFPWAVFLGHFATKLVVGGLLGLILVASAITVYRQRTSLTVVRKALIDQMDAATKNSARAERFYGLSILDPLTGLYNRRFGETRLEEEIAKAEGSGAPLLVAAMDFDGFKKINDTLGHDAGDVALKEFSRRLQRAVRACDVPIRVGGDEFLVILPDCPPDKVQMIISRMDAIEFVVNKKRVPLSFSYGMAQYQANDTSEALIKRADQRLYEVKAKKKAARGVEPTATRPAPVSGLAPRAERRPAPQPSAGSRREPLRRGVRLPVEIPVILIGSDLLGRHFSEETVTLDVSPHGAAVLSHQKLAAEQEVIVRCLGTNQEAEMQVVRAVKSEAGDFAYGLAFVHPGAHIWSVEFPPLREAEEERSGSLFTCTRCRSREVLDSADATGGNNPGPTMVRFCKRCGSETDWACVVGDRSACATEELKPAPAFAGEKSP